MRTLATAILTIGTLAGAFAGTTPASAATSPAPAPAPAPAITASGPTCPAWAVSRPPDPAVALDDLAGVAVLSAKNVWAVGQDAAGTVGPFRTLIAHWNGRAWKHVPSPNPGIGSNYLSSITAVSASNIWAAGEYSDQSGGIAADKTLILHWNGRSWKKVSSPSFGNFDGLNTIRAVSATNIWAVGLDGNLGSADRSLILHWNGHAWRTVPSPNPGKASDSLAGLAIVSARSIWTNELFTTKSGTPSTSNILHWNGQAWRKAAAGPAGSDLSDLSASSASNVWDVGDDAHGHSLALHWNGHSWTRASTPNIDPRSLINVLDSVTVVSPANAWAVGVAQNVFSTFEGTAIEMHWNGRKWSMMHSPANGGANSALFGVQATATASPWAVGEDGNSDMVQRTLALRCR